MLRENDPSGGTFDSHGICEDHGVQLLREIRARFHQALPLSLRDGPAAAPVGVAAGR